MVRIAIHGMTAAVDAEVSAFIHSESFMISATLRSIQIRSALFHWRFQVPVIMNGIFINS